MKTLRLLSVFFLLSTFTCIGVFHTGCQTAPSARVAQQQTLASIGATVEASMRVATQLLADGRITWAQWQGLADFHDKKLQPAYQLAVAAVRADLSSFASPDLVGLFTQFLAIVDTFAPPRK